MDPNVVKELRDQRQLIERIFISVEKTRKYFLWTLIITVALIVLPLIGLVFVIPQFINTYNTTYSSVMSGITP